MKRRDAIILVVILIAGALLRFSNLTHSSLWMDEIWSIEIACGRGHAHDQLAEGIIRTDQIDLTTLDSARRGGEFGRRVRITRIRRFIRWFCGVG